MGNDPDVRDQWSSKLDFILSSLGYAVGLGNIWRYPYLCGRNGGAAFMIVYAFMMACTGLPLFYMEMAIGQFASMTPALLYEKMCPVFRGIGWAMVAVAAYTALYYNMIIAWSLHYLVNSFRPSLPWQGCDHDWNTDRCFDYKVNESCVERGMIFFNRTCVNSTSAAFTQEAAEFYRKFAVGSSKEYLDRRVLGISEGIEHMGYPRWELVLALLVAWILVFACLSGGVKTSGKVVYFTCTFPYLVLLIFLIRGYTLPGAIDGLKFYIIPNVTKFKDPRVWIDAANQLFFSLGLGSGGLTTLSSYNKFNNNLLLDTLICVFGDSLTSFFACNVIFPILGYIALIQNKKVADLAAQGVGLVFVAYPDAISRLYPPQLWAILFFFMLVLLGIDSQNVMVDVVITTALDVFPQYRPPKKKLLMVGLICFLGFILGLFMTCPGGPYVLMLIDNYAAGWPLILICLIEVIMIGWVYGIRRFISDIRMMLGKPPNLVWKILGYPSNIYFHATWLVIAPSLILGVLIFNWASFTRSTYDENYVYPIWGDVIGWLMSLSCVGWIFVLGIIKVIQCIRNRMPLSTVVKPATDWKNSMARVKPVDQSNELRKF